MRHYIAILVSVVLWFFPMFQPVSAAEKPVLPIVRDNKETEAL